MLVLHILAMSKKRFGGNRPMAQAAGEKGSRRRSEKEAKWQKKRERESAQWDAGRAWLQVWLDF